MVQGCGKLHPFHANEPFLFIRQLIDDEVDGLVSSSKMSFQEWRAIWGGAGLYFRSVHFLPLSHLEDATCHFPFLRFFVVVVGADGRFEPVTLPRSMIRRNIWICLTSAASVSALALSLMKPILLESFTFFNESMSNVYSAPWSRNIQIIVDSFIRFWLAASDGR